MAEKSESKPMNTLQIGLDVNCADAITGLKAVQRELKAVTQAAKEMQVTLEGDDKGVPVQLDPNFSLYSYESKAIIFYSLVQTADRLGVELSDEYYKTMDKYLDRAHLDSKSKRIDHLFKVLQVQNEYSKRWIK